MPVQTPTLKTASNRCRAVCLTAALGAAVLAAPTHSQAAPVPVDLELILAVDVSGSIDADEAALQRQGYVNAITNPAVLDAIKSGFIGRIAVLYMEWSGPRNRNVLTDWTLIDGPESATAFAERLGGSPPTRGMYTSIHGALEFALPLFDDNDFEGTRRVIDVSGDGPNNTGGLVTFARDTAVARGVTINGLPIVNDRPSPWGRPPMPNLDLYYRDCVIGGPRAFLVVAESFTTFARAIRRKLLIEISGLDPTGLPGVLTATNGTASARLWPAAGDAAPPCDSGERMLQQRRLDFLDH